MNVEIVRSKCRHNKSDLNIFRYENKDFTFDIKKGHKKSVVSIDVNGNRVVYPTATEAAKQVNGNITLIIACCRKKRIEHKKFKWEYNVEN